MGIAGGLWRSETRVTLPFGTAIQVREIDLFSEGSPEWMRGDAMGIAGGCGA